MDLQDCPKRLSQSLEKTEAGETPFLPLRLTGRDENSPEKRVIQEEEQKIFKKAVHELPRKKRDVFILKKYSGFSYAQIAGILGIKEGTVMSRLNRARAAILDRLRKENDEWQKKEKMK